MFMGMYGNVWLESKVSANRIKRRLTSPQQLSPVLKWYVLGLSWMSIVIDLHTSFTARCQALWWLVQSEYNAYFSLLKILTLCICSSFTQKLPVLLQVAAIHVYILLKVIQDHSIIIWPERSHGHKETSNPWHSRSLLNWKVVRQRYRYKLILYLWRKWGHQP